MKYVKLVIDNKSDNTDMLYTYGCEYEQIEIGNKVYVPFSLGNKRKVGYVIEIQEDCDFDLKNLKYVDEIDEEVVLSEEIIETVKFMKNRYLCRYIDAINLFIPSGKKSIRGQRKNPIDVYKENRPNIKELTKEQKIAINTINEAVNNNITDMFLLHGVTASGKTEVYINAIENVLKKNKTAIMMVPEITLTKQLVERFIGKFGKNDIAIMHSKLTSGQRYDQWQKIKSGRAKIVIGARSAVFAPLNDIGIIILDEEHETTYKSDMSPKYETVEVAIKRLKLSEGVLVLGSATPSISSYYRSNIGIYKRIEIPNKYNGNSKPKVLSVDMRKELKDGNRSLISKSLYNEMERCFNNNKQVILLLNRRGYSTFISCRECGYVLKCEECDIAYTYHKYDNKGVCHYCGKKIDIPKTCPKCESRYFKYFGSGTEKVIEQVENLFPEKKVERLDIDAISKKGTTEKILKNFDKGKIDVLVGTQLVAKGLDYKNVDVVGIIAADAALNIPDFRSSERTFQLIMQATGRTGRGDKNGCVVVQTYEDSNYVIEAAINQNYLEFFNKEISIRKFLGYPPFGYLIQIAVFGKSQKAKLLANEFEGELRNRIDNKLIVNISDVKKEDDYKKYILLKCDQKYRNYYVKIISSIKEEVLKKRKKINVVIDVNPYNMWRN